MRIPKFLLTTIVLFNLSQSLFAQWQPASSGYGYYVDAPVAAGSGNSGFTQLWHDNAIMWKYGNSSIGGLRFGSATNLNAGNWTERVRITDNGDVAIGTTTPRGKLDIWGGTMYITGSDLAGTLVAGVQAGVAYLGNNSLTNGIAISGDNRVGITTSTPQAILSLGSGNVNGKSLLIKDDGTVNGVQAGMGIDMSGTSRELSIFHSTSDGVNGIISFGKRQESAGTYTEAMRITGAGNVGIGTADTKTYKLAVNGNAIFNKVVVKAYPWADYVFYSNYRLRPLSEVEQYINRYHHLPDVPSAEEVEKNGVDVGDNQATLLKKIEELTLYIIEQNKKIEKLTEQNKRLNQLEKKLEELNNLVQQNVH
jgi:hypothetical protein